MNRNLTKALEKMLLSLVSKSDCSEAAKGISLETVSVSTVKCSMGSTTTSQCPLPAQSSAKAPQPSNIGRLPPAVKGHSMLHARH